MSDVNPLGTTPPSGNSPPPAAGAGDPPSATARPDWAPEAHWDTEKGAFKDTFGAHYAELSAARQTETDRLAAFPKTADDYALDLPADFEVPEGFDRAAIKIDLENPLFKEGRALLHEAKIDPATGSKLAGLIVKNQLAETKLVNDRIAAEAKKLGDNSVQRIAAAKTALAAHIDQSHVEAIAANLWTADMVKAVEAIVAKFASQGSASPPAHGAGDPPPPEQTIEQRWYGPLQAKG